MLVAHVRVTVVALFISKVVAVSVTIGVTAEKFFSDINEYRGVSIIDGLCFLKLTGLAIKSMVICLSNEIYICFNQITTFTSEILK